MRARDGWLTTYAFWRPVGQGLTLVRNARAEEEVVCQSVGQAL
jgi:hypothetical protein